MKRLFNKQNAKFSKDIYSEKGNVLLKEMFELSEE